MALESINPASGDVLARFPELDAPAIEQALAEAAAATLVWPKTAFGERARLFRALAAALRREETRLARLITTEMGKPLREARAEVEKCAWGCEFHADHAEHLLADETVATNASRSLVSYAPLGTVLAIMPWNFPFWQVFRAAAPALMAGNTVLLKHASNVPQCAQAIDALFRDAGFPRGVFRNLPIGGATAERLIADARVHGVTLTGSEAAGRRVAAAAGAQLKKCVLELGGSDPFVVLADADLDLAAATAITARFQNAGQSCIAAKRFILVDAIADDFVDRLVPRVEALRTGDPLSDDTDLGPLARADLREAVHRQVRDSIAAGARLLLGGEPRPGDGFYYRPTMLDGVRAGMPVYGEEVFGPVLAVLRARDEDEALRLANDTRYGLGASVWSRDAARAEQFVRAVRSGLGFVNGMVHSDPRLPFGGVKASGYGRELGFAGIREFVNVRTIWVR
jgi:succinate-semialdehyde dehydrogenase/glutarate-semialdehyde dehydrogenase